MHSQKLYVTVHCLSLCSFVSLYYFGDLGLLFSRFYLWRPLMCGHASLVIQLQANDLESGGNARGDGDDQKASGTRNGDHQMEPQDSRSERKDGSLGGSVLCHWLQRLILSKYHLTSSHIRLASLSNRFRSVYQLFSFQFLISVFA